MRLTIFYPDCIAPIFCIFRIHTRGSLREGAILNLPVGFVFLLRRCRLHPRHQGMYYRALCTVPLLQKTLLCTSAILAMKVPQTLMMSRSQRYAVPAFCAIITGIIVILEGELTSKFHCRAHSSIYAVLMIIQYCRGWLLVRKICPLARRKPSLSPWFRVSTRVEYRHICLKLGPQVTVFTLYSIAVLGYGPSAPMDSQKV